MIEKPKIIILVGATAVGKTSLALQVAPEINAEIISADSRLFYRGMNIGTAKPTSDELKLVRHHLIDIAEPDENISLGTYKVLVTKCIEDIQSRGKIALLVGGTGQYIRTIVEGWSIPEVVPDPKLRKELEKLMVMNGLHKLTDWLKILDPVYFQQVDLLNHRRILRAIEVILTTGKPISGQRTKGGSLYDSLIVGLRRPRMELYKRIDERIDAMVSYGLVTEVENLIKKGYSVELSSFSAIGYAEIALYLQGLYSLDEAIMLIKRRTHLFVRRQANWFKESDPMIFWIDAEADAKSQVTKLIKQHIYTAVQNEF